MFFQWRVPPRPKAAWRWFARSPLPPLYSTFVAHDSASCSRPESMPFESCPCRPASDIFFTPNWDGCWAWIIRTSTRTHTPRQDPPRAVTLRAAPRTRRPASGNVAAGPETACAVCTSTQLVIMHTLENVSTDKEESTYINTGLVLPITVVDNRACWITLKRIQGQSSLFY